MNIFKKILFVYLVKEIAFAQDIGDPCEQHGGGQGTCQCISKCQSALLEIQKGIYPTICGYEGNKPIICCPDVTAFNTLHARMYLDPSSSNWIWSSSTSKPGDISKAKCKEYANIYKKGSASGERKIECPFTEQQLISGGVKCRKNEFPHMAHLGYGSEDDLTWDCAGSIISPNYILTAAHCLTATSGPTFVRVGITNQTEVYDRQTIKVADTIRHPNYISKYHDIGLIKLENAIKFDTTARPACLYTQRTISGKMAFATGWGNTEFGGIQSNDLMKVLLEKFTPEKCNNTYRREFKLGLLKDGIVDDYMVCYGSKTSLKDTCQGDSGGPLQMYHPETEDIECMYQIIGITSFGKACGLAVSLPGVYTRVSKYIEWIEKIVWP